jgi:hypothetical protein
MRSMLSWFETQSKKRNLYWSTACVIEARAVLKQEQRFAERRKQLRRVFPDDGFAALPDMNRAATLAPAVG